MTWGVATDPQMVRNYRVTVLGHTTVVNGDGEIVYNGPPLGSYDRLKNIVEDTL